MDGVDQIIDELHAKNAWIQKAKALLFDCQFSLDSRQLTQECIDLLKEAGGYDFQVESSKTPLIWKR
jgi:hypothetical protein